MWNSRCRGGGRLLLCGRLSTGEESRRQTDPAPAWGVGGLLTNFLASWSDSEIAVNDTGDWAPHLLVGESADEWQELYQQISPIVHVGPDTPPTLQFVGEHDVYVSRSSSELALHRRLRDKRHSLRSRRLGDWSTPFTTSCNSAR